MAFCLIGFTINSLATIKAFLNGAKVSSQQYYSKYQSPVQMILPTLVLCNADIQALNTEIGTDIFTMERQDSNAGNSLDFTLHIIYFLILRFNQESEYWTWEQLYVSVEIRGTKEKLNDSDIFSVEKLYTRYFGICFAMTFKHQVGSVFF